MIFEKKLTVPASATDHDAKVGVVGAITFLQDNMCDYFGEMKCDGITMIPVCNAFFVITKTKFKFYKNIKWKDSVILKSSVSDVSKIRVNLNNNILDENGVCVEGVQELCAIDKDSRKIRTVESTLFPKEIALDKKNDDLNFAKFNFDSSDFIFQKDIEINLSNVDYYMHTNNTEYAKFCMSVLPYLVFENKEVDTFEIHYIKESVMGDKLSIYTNKNNEIIDFIIMNNQDVVVKAQMVLKDRI